MPHQLPIFSQSDYLVQVVDINSYNEWQTVQIQISWLLQKPTDLDQHCLQRQGISGFSRTRVNLLKTKSQQNRTNVLMLKCLDTDLCIMWTVKIWTKMHILACQVVLLFFFENMLWQFVWMISWLIKHCNNSSKQYSKISYSKILF